MLLLVNLREKHDNLSSWGYIYRPTQLPSCGCTYSTFFWRATLHCMACSSSIGVSSLPPKRFSESTITTPEDSPFSTTSFGFSSSSLYFSFFSSLFRVLMVLKNRILKYSFISEYQVFKKKEEEKSAEVSVVIPTVQ